MSKNGWKHKLVFLFWTRPTNLWCIMLQTLERQEIWSGEVVLFCQMNTLKWKERTERIQTYEFLVS